MVSLPCGSTFLAFGVRAWSLNKSFGSRMMTWSLPDVGPSWSLGVSRDQSQSLPLSGNSAFQVLQHVVSSCFFVVWISSLSLVIELLWFGQRLSRMSLLARWQPRG